VQSDKASVEITSPCDGTIKEILVQEGQIAKVGEDLCVIEVVDEGAPNTPDTPTSDSLDPSTNEGIPPPAPPQEPKNAPSVSESGGAQTQSDKHPVARRPHPHDPNAPPTSSEPGVSITSTDVLALPAVRHLARENGVDITLLAPGSGKNGRVERADVERYLASGASAAAAAPPSPPAAEGDIVVELGRTRYGMWKAMEKVRAPCARLYAFAVPHHLSFCSPFCRAWKFLTLGERAVPLLARFFFCIAYMRF
jgi:2-oxoisovalerate dehydrogenase E2 component (dihydrolipoyl transacylase)